MGRAGVQRGDVIYSVNGNRLKRPEDLVRLWSSLGKARRLVIRLVREGEPLVFVVEIRDGQGAT